MKTLDFMVVFQTKETQIQATVDLSMTAPVLSWEIVDAAYEKLCSHALGRIHIKPESQLRPELQLKQVFNVVCVTKL